MKTLASLILVTGNCIALAQTNQPADDRKPAPSNMPGQQYPQVHSEGRVRARLLAPQAQSAQLNIGDVKFPMVKDTNGFWLGDSTVQDQGNHYYDLVVDGADVFSTISPALPFVWTDTNSAAPQRFYRVKLGPPLPI